MSFCFNNTSQAKKNLSSPLINPVLVDNFDSGVDPQIWINKYRKWVNEEGKCCNSIFESTPDDTFNAKEYDSNGDGVEDNYTLNDPRLLRVHDEVFDKDYFVFSKNCKSIVYMDNSLDTNGLPTYKTATYNPSQLIRDIIVLDDMDIIDDLQRDYKKKLYDVCWDVLEPDVQLLIKNELVYFPGNPTKSLTMNKIILDLNNPLFNPLLTDEFDSGYDPFNGVLCGNPNVKKITIPPTINQAIYDGIMEKINPSNDLYVPTFLSNPSGIYDDPTYNNDIGKIDNTGGKTTGGVTTGNVTTGGITTDVNGDIITGGYVVGGDVRNGILYDGTIYGGMYEKDIYKINDVNNLINGFTNGGMVPIKTTSTPIILISKNDTTITYYDLDLGTIVKHNWDWNAVLLHLGLLDVNGLSNPSYEVMKDDIFTKYQDKIDSALLKINTIRDKLEEVKSTLLSLMSYTDPETCFRLSVALDFSGPNALKTFLDFSECLLKNFSKMIMEMRNLSDIQKLASSVMGAAMKYAGMGGLSNELSRLESLANKYTSILENGQSANIPVGNSGISVKPSLGVDTSCLLAKTMLDEKLREGYDTLKALLGIGTDFNKVLDEINSLRRDLVGGGIKSCLDKHYPNLVL